MTALKDKRKNSRNENLEINFTFFFVKITPKNLEKKNLRFFFLTFG